MRRKSAKSSYIFKLVSALMCLCMLTGVFQAQILSASADTVPEVYIARDGKAVSELSLPQTDKITLTAEAAPENKNTTFRWQLLSSVTDGEWINIFDGTSKSFTLSYLTVENLLDESGSVYLRACAANNDLCGYSEPTAVTVYYNVPEDESSLLTPAPQTTLQNDENEVSNDPEYVDISINYLDSSAGLAIYSGYSAQIQKVTSYTSSVISPTYLGYAPFYNKSNPSIKKTDGVEIDAPDDASVIYLDIPEDFDGDSYVVNVYYKPIDVPFAARYFFQNINDDFYSEDYGLYKLDYAKTGTIISNEQLEASDPDRVKGFTKLYHYPEAVAADGSTIFECYYDRNYYILKFDMDGGYGTEPIYARYGTPFVVNEPTRHGYIFAGWDLLIDGVGDGIADVLPSSVPAENQSYKALWTTVRTKYTTVYWLQNADDDGYSYKGSTVSYADSGTLVSGSDDLTDQTPICGNTDADHTHTDECYPDELEHAEFEKADKDVTVNGDGSTVVNVYYTRKYYTLRFIYAKEYNGVYDYYGSSSFKGIRYLIVGGSTHGFGNQNTSRRPWPNGTGNDYSLDDIIYNMNKCEGNSEQWGTIYETNDQTEDYSRLPQIIQPNVAGAEYKTGIYPEPGTGYKEGDKGNGNYNQRGDRFFYFELTARYGADLTELWPTAVFDKVQVAHPERHTANGAYKNLENDGWGNYAYLAGWNGEYKVGYSLANSNSTIKGRYQKLNETVIFGSLGGTDFSYENDSKIDRIITTQTTVGGKEVTSRVNYFVNFFNNGMGVSWNVPREWNYQIYVPIFSGELTSDQIELVKAAAAEDNTYTLPASANDSKVYHYGSTVDIDGNTYYYYNSTVYRLFDTVNTSDDGRDASNQTQTALEGFSFESGSLGNNTRRSERVYNGLLADNRESYTVRFFYKRDNFSLVMHNYNEIYLSKTNVDFDSEVDDYVYDGDGDQVVPDYPKTLEENAYVFRGWYESPGCYDGSEYTKGTLMPAANLSLYAKWDAIPHTVRFFKNYESLLKFKQNGDESGLIETRTVPHGNVVGSVDNAVDDSEYKYTFSGWFQIKKGEKTAFTPLDMPVTNDINVFADWGSQSAQPYVIHYALDNPETNAEIIALLDDAAEGEPSDNTEYTVSINGEQAKYIYLESDGKYHLSIADQTRGFAYQGNTRTFHPKAGDPYNQLYDDYNIGYYPTLAGHSISIQYEENKAEPKHNIFTFIYVYKESIDYTAEYRYLDTGELITSAPGNGQVEKNTKLAVVTERFAVVTDYMPDAFYKRLILAVEKDKDGNVISSPDNVVVFYYSKNELNAFYAVHHMLQNADADSDEPVSDGNGGYTNYTENKAHTEGIGEIGKEINIEPQNFIGFTVYGKGLIKGQTDFIDLNDEMSSHPYFTVTVEADETELYIFYTRNIQNYKIYHLRYGTDISNLDSLEYTDKSNGVLAPVESGSDKNGRTITASCKTVDEIPGMSCISEFTKSIVLRANDKQNHIIFYYSPLQFTVEYKVWQYGGGSLDRTIEVVNGTDTFTGSAPAAQSGYVFDGWYLDEACTVPAVSSPASDSDKATLSGERLVPTTAKLDPTPKTNVFYAKFVPTYGNLTIVRKNAADEANGDTTFVYKISSVSNPDHIMYVSITGYGSETVKNLPCGEYTVEQVGGWSWRYSDSSVTVDIKSGENSVTFEKAAQNRNWLNGNSKKIQNRKG